MFIDCHRVCVLLQPGIQQKKTSLGIYKLKVGNDKLEGHMRGHNELSTFLTFLKILPALRCSLILVHSTWITLCQIKIHLLPLKHWVFFCRWSVSTYCFR